MIARRDPLAGEDPLIWPNLDAVPLSLWDPISVGVDENGNPIEVSLVEKNVLLGGEPGAGKSVALSMLVATAALDPDVRLTLLDGKRVELAAWGGCATHSVGPNVSEAIDVLRKLQNEMDERYLSLLANRRRKVERHDEMPLHVIVCDELAFYLNPGDRKTGAEFANVLRDLVARGRAAGIVVLAATQKPSHDIVPTHLRDLFAVRWALRCTTPQASDTILGQGWASLGYSAATVDASQRGVGFLLHEGAMPVRLRACYLSDDAIARLAARAEELRSSREPNLRTVRSA
jgi:S-DNA-T family DNA segregation ATPase FtsK/SpoIIIE